MKFEETKAYCNTIQELHKAIYDCTPQQVKVTYSSALKLFIGFLYTK